MFLLVMQQFQTIIDSRQSAKVKSEKRVSDAAQSTGNIVETAALDAVAKRVRPSSSMPIVGPLQAAFMKQAKFEDADVLCSMKIADMIHSCNLPDGFGQNPKFLSVLGAFKGTSGSVRTSWARASSARRRGRGRS